MTDGDLSDQVSSVDVADLPSAEKNHGKSAKPQTSVALAANKPKPPTPAAPTPRRAHGPVGTRARTGDDSADGNRGDAPETPPPPATRPPAKAQQPAPETGLPASELTREPPF